MTSKFEYHVVRRLKRSEPEPESTEDVVQFFRDKMKGESRMQRFWDLVKDSTIVQGLITLGVVGVTCYLWATGQQVPQELWTADGIILGFFFGAKTQQIIARGR